MIYSPGFIRQVDEIGRITIPKELRHFMRINDGATVEILPTSDGTILIRKYPYPTGSGKSRTKGPAVK